MTLLGKRDKDSDKVKLIETADLEVENVRLVSYILFKFYNYYINTGRGKIIDYI